MVTLPAGYTVRHFPARDRVIGSRESWRVYYEPAPGMQWTRRVYADADIPGAIAEHVAAGQPVHLTDTGWRMRRDAQIKATAAAGVGYGVIAREHGIEPEAVQRIVGHSRVRFEPTVAHRVRFEPDS